MNSTQSPTLRDALLRIYNLMKSPSAPDYRINEAARIADAALAAADATDQGQDEPTTPYGPVTCYRCTEAELARPAPIGAVAPDAMAGSIIAHDFLKWNRSLDKPVVEISKELYVARKVLEIASAAPAAPSGKYDVQKLATLIDWFRAGQLPENLMWNVQVTAEVLRVALAPAAPIAEVTDDLAARGYVVGATVEQDTGKPWASQAVITCVHPNGALDVIEGATVYGWSAQFCKPVAPPATSPANPPPSLLDTIERERVAGQSEREQFEARYKLGDKSKEQGEFGEYLNIHVQFAWEGWQARGQQVVAVDGTPSTNSAAGWISVDERLPEDGVYVWAHWCGAGDWNADPRMGEARRACGGWQPAGNVGFDWSVTHWQPLPAAPTMQQSTTPNEGDAQ